MCVIKMRIFSRAFLIKNCCYMLCLWCSNCTFIGTVWTVCFGYETKKESMMISIRRYRKSFDLQIYSSLKKSFLLRQKEKKNRETDKCKLKLKFQSMLQIIHVHSYCEESNLFLRPDKTVIRCFNKFITSVTIIDLSINIVKAIPIYVSRVA